jgi:hypothetical protein
VFLRPWRFLFANARWQLPLFRALGVMVPCWLATEWMLRGAPDWSRLVIIGSLLSVTGAWVSLRFALPPELVGEMIGKLSGPLQRTTAFLAGQSGGKKTKSNMKNLHNYKAMSHAQIQL